MAEDYEKELKFFSQGSNKEYELPDGQKISIGDELITCPEALFNPSNLGFNVPGIHETVFNSVMKCDIDLREKLFSNIVLTGGTSLFPGFHNRIKKELNKLTTSNIKIIATSDSLLATWVGGSILASLSTFGSKWMSRQEYNEKGPWFVDQKFYF